MQLLEIVELFKKSLTMASWSKHKFVDKISKIYETDKKGIQISFRANDLFKDHLKEENISRIKNEKDQVKSWKNKT